MCSLLAGNLFRGGCTPKLAMPAATPLLPSPCLVWTSSCSLFQQKGRRAVTSVAPPSTSRRHTTTHDVMDAARAQAMHATLDCGGALPMKGDVCPPFWHQIYFWNAKRSSWLGLDGHAATGGSGEGVIPQFDGLSRRMWAGGQLKFCRRRLLLGKEAQLKTTVSGVEEKTGRTGRLGFVHLMHEVSQGSAICVLERQDLVYMEEKPLGTPAPPKSHSSSSAHFDETVSKKVEFSSVELFRYSALTFNGHRIHYDLDYCRNIEGYPGLVVHGPLLAQLLIHMAEQQLKSAGHVLTEFNFKATSPVFHFETVELCWKPHQVHVSVDTCLDAASGGKHAAAAGAVAAAMGATESESNNFFKASMWVRGPEGRLCMEATVFGEREAAQWPAAGPQQHAA